MHATAFLSFKTSHISKNRHTQTGLFQFCISSSWLIKETPWNGLMLPPPESSVASLGLCDISGATCEDLWPTKATLDFTIRDEDWGKKDDHLGSCSLKFEAWQGLGFPTWSVPGWIAQSSQTSRFVTWLFDSSHMKKQLNARRFRNPLKNATPIWKPKLFVRLILPFIIPDNFAYCSIDIPSTARSSFLILFEAWGKAPSSIPTVNHYRPHLWQLGNPSLWLTWHLSARISWRTFKVTWWEWYSLCCHPNDLKVFCCLPALSSNQAWLQEPWKEAGVFPYLPPTALSSE